MAACSRGWGAYRRPCKEFYFKQSVHHTHTTTAPTATRRRASRTFIPVWAKLPRQPSFGFKRRKSRYKTKFTTMHSSMRGQKLRPLVLALSNITSSTLPESAIIPRLDPCDFFWSMVISIFFGTATSHSIVVCMPIATSRTISLLSYTTKWLNRVRVQVNAFLPG